jgi:peptidoglycan hydrolase-like protein with peptidoglycan-binding domain
MRKLAFIAITATALPLIAAPPSIAQQSGQQNPAQDQAQQPQSSPSAPQPTHEHSNMSGDRKGAANLGEDEIRQIQQALNEKGFDTGRPDGKLGPRTKRALNEFQKRQGLQPSGMPDEQTLAALGVGGGTNTTGQGTSGQRNGGSRNQNPAGQQRQQQQPAGNR